MMDRLDAFAVRRHALDSAVDVWLLDPAALQQPQDVLAACLDATERRRLDGLRREADRALYLAAHAFLRHLLTLYQPDVHPAHWTFEIGVHGRPEVAAEGLRFSLSHTRGLVAVAVARDWDVGIDVEGERAGLDLAAIEPAALAAEERRWVRSLPPTLRKEAFLGLWTMKESLLKAHGLGIGEELGHIALVGSWTEPRAVITRSQRLASRRPRNVVVGRVAGRYALALTAAGPLATSATPASWQRRVALFDLRDARVPPEGSVLAPAFVLPVLHAPSTPRMESNQAIEVMNV